MMASQAGHPETDDGKVPNSSILFMTEDIPEAKVEEEKSIGESGSDGTDDAREEVENLPIAAKHSLVRGATLILRLTV